MNNRRGILGSTIVIIFSIIAIVIILLIFIIGAELVKSSDSKATGVNVMSERHVGIDNVFDYMNWFWTLFDVRYHVAGGSALELMLVSYEGEEGVEDVYISGEEPIEG